MKKGKPKKQWRIVENHSTLFMAVLRNHFYFRDLSSSSWKLRNWKSKPSDWLFCDPNGSILFIRRHWIVFYRENEQKRKNKQQKEADPKVKHVFNSYVRHFLPFFRFYPFILLLETFFKRTHTPSIQSWYIAFLVFPLFIISIQEKTGHSALYSQSNAHTSMLHVFVLNFSTAWAFAFGSHTWMLANKDQTEFRLCVHCTTWSTSHFWVYSFAFQFEHTKRSL